LRAGTFLIQLNSIAVYHDQQGAVIHLRLVRGVDSGVDNG
jgi:hypothetical protein